MSPEGPRRTHRRRGGRLALHARQPEGRIPGALGPRGRLSALVRCDPRHPHPRVLVVRLAAGGTRIDRNRPVRFTFDGTEYEGFAGDTIASALLANDVAVVGAACTPAGRGASSRPDRGAERARPGRLAERQCREPMLRATAVEIVDALVTHSLAGRGRLVEDRQRPLRQAVPARRGAGRRWREGRRAATEAAAVGSGDRVLLVDEARPWTQSPASR